MTFLMESYDDAHGSGATGSYGPSTRR
jgi:hypothetical protein